MSMCFEIKINNSCFDVYLYHFDGVVNCLVAGHHVHNYIT